MVPFYFWCGAFWGSGSHPSDSGTANGAFGFENHGERILSEIS